MALTKADEEILAALRRSKGGLTSEQLEQRLKRSHQSVSANLTRLRRSMKIRPETEKRKASSGRFQSVWVLGAMLCAPPSASRQRKGLVPVALPVLGQKLDPNAWKAHVKPTAHLDIAILTVLSTGGKLGWMTEDVVERTGRAHQSVSGQIRRLVGRGLVVHSGIVARSKSGRRSMRWIVNPKLGSTTDVMQGTLSHTALPVMPKREDEQSRKRKDAVPSLQKVSTVARLPPPG